MGKKNRKNPADILAEMIRNLEKDYEHHADIVLNGCSDPTWTDGANINLVRNHIISDRNAIISYCEEHFLAVPDICSQPIPDKVDENYMARAEEIREKAGRTLDRFRADENLAYLENLEFEPVDKSLRQRLESVVSYRKALELAIENDDLVRQRSISWKDGSSSIEAFAAMSEIMRSLPREKLREKTEREDFQPVNSVQLSFF